MSPESSELPPSPWARTSGYTPLIPLLPASETADAVVLATWREAISSSLLPDIPHDLLAIWLYPGPGGVVLLGPAELEQDELAVPLPSPTIPPDQLRLLEDIVRDAGYPSVACVAIGFGQRDVGLILAADLRPDRYGFAELGMLDEAARQLAPTFERLARGWRAVPGASLEKASGLVDELGQAAAHARTPRAYMRAVSSALDPLLPHDRLELFVVGGSPDQSYRLGEHGEGPLWSDAALVVDREDLDVPALLPSTDPTLIADTRADLRWSRSGAALLGMNDIRSVLATRLVLGGRTVGFMLLGSTGVEFYQSGDAELLQRVAPLIATRVDAFVQAWQLNALRAQIGQQNAVPEQLRRMIALLAMTASPPAALREFVSEATALLPFHRIRLAVRLADEDRAALFVPGETRALADLPLVPVIGTAVGRVLTGELSNAVAGSAPDVELVFPLRVAGQITGAMVLSTDTPDAFSRAHLVLAQQVADLLAPHIELIRRSAIVPGMMPGWKRAPK